jgi:hypothetical protein
MPLPFLRRAAVLAVLAVLALVPAPARSAGTPARVYVILWFDTEDYMLPASDDAALMVADFLSRENIRGTFKVVGEKARTLERRKRFDVIAALKKHEIGYHSNYHSTQPTPAMYLNKLGWDEGVAEFDRREGPGRADVQRIFGAAPSCYGQPGSSWGPQSYGAMRKWGMKVYLDAGSHVNLDGRPCYYGGLLNLYKLTHTIRADLTAPRRLAAAQDRFAEARRALLTEGGGVVSTIYHPCEFVHQQFWDAVNFTSGANPPRSRWKRPPQKTAAETRAAFAVFKEYVRYMKRFPDVRFITASEAGRLYHDRARGRKFTLDELKAVAAAVGKDITFQKHRGYALAPSEVLALLNTFVAGRVAGHDPAPIELKDTPYGPSRAAASLDAAVTTDGDQFGRTATDVADYLRHHGRVPATVWLGSTAIPPQAYLRALAEVAQVLLDGKPMPRSVTVRPARLAAGDHVSADGPHLWGWIIFPRGFRAPELMKLARRQAWTLKPALLDRSARDGQR